MKKLLFLLLLIPSLGFSEGPLFTHKDTADQQEFENVYQDIRGKLSNNTLSYTSTSTCIDSPTFCVDRTNDRVGIGTSSPAAGYKLDIQRNTAGDTGQIRASGDNGTSDGGSGISLAYNNTTKWSLFSRNVAANSHTFALSTSEGDYSAAVFKATQSGEITQPKQPSFVAQYTSGITDISGDGTTYTVAFNTEISDLGSDYDNTTYTFTAPVSGLYLFCISGSWSGLTSAMTVFGESIVTSNRNYSSTKLVGTFGYARFPYSQCNVVDMDANDTAKVSVTASNGTKTADLDSPGTFSGSLIN